MKPRTLQDAVSAIRATFPASELEDWAAQPELQAMLQAHFQLGMWVRNQWVHGSGSPLADTIKQRASFLHDDTVSSVVVTALWRVLNGKPCPTIEELVSPDEF